MLTRRSVLAGAGAAFAAAARAQVPEFDLVVRGGEVIDPSQNVRGFYDVGIKNGVVTAVEAGINPSRAAQSYDATGKIITPGLVDLHVHCWPKGNALGTAPDILAREECTTTVVSAGDCAASTAAAFHATVIAPSRARAFAFMMVSKAAYSAWPISEFPNADYVSANEAASVLVANADWLLGVKVRTSFLVAGALDLMPLQRAIDICNAATQASGKPFKVMCHIGALRLPSMMPQIVDMLRAGDIITHSFVGIANQDNAATGLAQNFQCIPAAQAAKNKGIILDVGWGGSPAGQPIGPWGSFDYLTAEICLQNGLRLDTLSSDSHVWPFAAGVGRMHLTEVMANFLALNVGANVSPLLPGLGGNLNPPITLEDVIRMATVTPAQVINRIPKLGTLKIGAPGDVAVLQLVNGPVTFNDTLGHALQASQRILPVQAIVGGQLL